MWKEMDKYFSKHTIFNATVHTVAGIGIGALITGPLLDPHPVRWGLTFLLIAVLGHVYTMWVK